MSSDLKYAPEGQPDKSGDEYAFLQETIKGDQAKGRNLLKKGIFAIFCGFLFGAAFCFGMNMMGGYLADSRMDLSGDMSGPEEDGGASPGSAPGVQAVIGSAGGEKRLADTAKGQKKEVELNSDNYKSLYSKMKEIRARLEKSLVNITGYENTDDEEASVAAGGCILYAGGRRLFILVCEGLKNMKRIDVEFPGGQVAAASVWAEYEVMDLTILGVFRSELDKNTERLANPVELGTSAGIMPGDPVLAMGNIYGFSGAAGYGAIQDVSGEISLEDGLFYRMKTDIQGTREGSGILANLQGEVIGIVMPVSADEEGKVSGIGISSLKKVLHFLQKGEKVPYTGIVGTKVTEEAAEEQSLPEGVYVQNVAADSPAMRAGIKNGDILESVGGREVISMEDYQQQLLKCKFGQTISIQGKRRGNDGFVDMEFTVELK